MRIQRLFTHLGRRCPIAALAGAAAIQWGATAQTLPPAASNPPPSASAAQPTAPAQPTTTAVQLTPAICPVQSPPQMPRAALQQGLDGVVVMTARIQDGQAQVLSLTGPEAYHPAIRQSVAQYQCAPRPEPLIVTQQFNFKIDTTRRATAP